MDLKKIIIGAARKEAVNKILPMESDAPKLGWKTKLAGILTTIAAVAAAAAQFLGG